jgi:hypothetical protein
VLVAVTDIVLMKVAKQASVKVITTVCGLDVTREKSTGATDITSDARDIGKRAAVVLIDDEAEIKSGSQYGGIAYVPTELRAIVIGGYSYGMVLYSGGLF